MTEIPRTPAFATSDSDRGGSGFISTGAGAGCPESENGCPYCPQRSVEEGPRTGHEMSFKNSRTIPLELLKASPRCPKCRAGFSSRSFCASPRSFLSPYLHQLLQGGCAQPTPIAGVNPSAETRKLGTGYHLLTIRCQQASLSPYWRRLVKRRRCVMKARTAPCCAKDEGGPFGVAL
jgi:hypothetical protein